MGDKAVARKERQLSIQKELHDSRYIFLANLQAPGRTLQELREVMSIPDDRFLRFLLDMEEKRLIRVEPGSASCSHWILTHEGEKELLEHLRER